MKKTIQEIVGLKMDKNHEFLVIGGFCWGKGSTIEQAVKNASYNGDVSRAFCSIVPIVSKIGGDWNICQVSGGLTIYNTDNKNDPNVKTWDYEKDEIFLQLWRKKFHIKATKRGKIQKYGFNLFE